VLLWTRYTGDAALRAVVWEGAEEPRSLVERSVDRGVDGYTVTPLTGLRANTWFGFRFEAVDSAGFVVARSPEGRFRTAPSAEAQERLVIGATSCTKFGFPFSTVARAAEDQRLDAFLLLGDTVYADGAASLSDFREKWSDTIGSKEYRALRASTSVISTWDDHEIANNWSGDNVDAQIYAHAVRAFTENQPLRTDPDRPHRFWRKLSWGRTVEFFVLDARSERQPAAHEYLSAEQADWLVQGLASSRATFKLILNSVPVGDFDAPFVKPFEHDMWLGFPEQRGAVLTAIEDAGVTGVVWVSGDFHLGCVGRVSKEGPGSSMLEVLVGPGAQAPNVLPSYPGPPVHDWATGINSYTTFDLNPTTGEVGVRFHGGDGRIIFDRVYKP
jgi:alkaline phosphatase D